MTMIGTCIINSSASVKLETRARTKIEKKYSTCVIPQLRFPSWTEVYVQDKKIKSHSRFQHLRPSDVFLCDQSCDLHVALRGVRLEDHELFHRVAAITRCPADQLLGLRVWAHGVVTAAGTRQGEVASTARLSLALPADRHDCQCASTTR